MREGAGLTQTELAKKVGTTQSVIARLEDSEYTGHSLTMLARVARRSYGRLRSCVHAARVFGCSALVISPCGQRRIRDSNDWLVFE